MKRATVRAVAKSAGVSIATVSRTFSNPSLVTDEARKRVEAAARSLQFTPRPRPRRTPVHSRSRRVGLLAFDYQHTLMDENITEEFWKGAHSVLSRRGVELVMEYIDETDGLEGGLARVLSDSSVEGYLVRAFTSRSALQQLARSTKIVLVGNTYADLNLPCVVADDFAGMSLLLDHLFKLGHRRIAFVGPPTCGLIYQRRLQAYRLFMMERTPYVDEKLIKVVESKDSWWLPAEDDARRCGQFLDELMRLTPPPTAIACATDSFALGLMATARERGLNVPGDLSITGFGNRSYTLASHPTLTTVHVDQRALGAWAAVMLLEIIAGVPRTVQAIVQPTFVERNSCAAASARMHPTHAQV